MTLDEYRALQKLEANLEVWLSDMQTASQNVRQATASSDRTAGYAKRKKAQMDHDTQIVAQMHTTRLRGVEERN